MAKTRDAPNLRNDGITLSTGKLECVSLREIDFMCQRSAQKTLRPEVTAAYRGLGNTQAPCGVLDVHVLDGTKHKNKTEGFRQLVQLALEQGAHLCTSNNLVRQIRL